MEALTIPDLANACEMSLEYPDLKIASRTDVGNLSINDFVELSHAGERFEVKVEEINGDQFIGTVRSDLVFNHPFKLGDSIHFSTNNVINVFSLPVVETKLANESFKKANKET